MYRRLPPLNAVRTFEAAARLKSFTAAADELGVTHGAVSRQVQLLEDWLGIALFVRSNRRVDLTADAQTYLVETSAMLDRLALATGRLTGQRGMRVLRVNASQTFTIRWLIARLPAFARAHPDIEIRLTTSVVPIQQLIEPFDVAIRRGGMQRGGVVSVPFLSETCVPVMSPKLLEKTPVLRLGDLLQCTLLHAESLSELWPSWLNAAGVPELRPVNELRFEHLYYALQAAVDGVGIAIGPSALVADDLLTGRLVTPFQNPVLKLDDFHVWAPTSGREHGPHRAFLNWIVAENRSTTG